MQLDQVRAVVTGGASGLGFAVAKRLAAHGAKVALLDVNDEKGHAAAAEIGASYFRADVTDESAIVATLKNTAIFASMTYSISDPNAAIRYSALNQRVYTGLAGANGQQKISDIEAELSFAQSTMKDAKTRQADHKVELEDLLQGIEQVKPEEVAAQVLALQTQLQASLQTTAMLSSLSIINYL